MYRNDLVLHQPNELDKGQLKHDLDVSAERARGAAAHDERRTDPRNASSSTPGGPFGDARSPRPPPASAPTDLKGRRRLQHRDDLVARDVALHLAVVQNDFFLQPPLGLTPSMRPSKAFRQPVRRAETEQHEHLDRIIATTLCANAARTVVLGDGNHDLGERRAVLTPLQSEV